MDIFFNANPEFTKWIASSGALREPFVVLDVGVLGGENPRWHFLGDHLVVHGFDAIKEVIDNLSTKNGKATNKMYHWFAIGNEDGEREFFFKPSNPTNSSFYKVPDPELQSRVVPVRKLDTLLREGVIPKADFLKVDASGTYFWARASYLRPSCWESNARAIFPLAQRTPTRISDWSKACCCSMACSCSTSISTVFLELPTMTLAVVETYLRCLLREPEGPRHSTCCSAGI